MTDRISAEAHFALPAVLELPHAVPHPPLQESESRRTHGTPSAIVGPGFSIAYAGPDDAIGAWLNDGVR